MKKLAGVFLLLGCTAVQAATVTIDFEEFPVGTTALPPVQSNDFTIIAGDPGKFFPGQIEPWRNSSALGVHSVAEDDNGAEIVFVIRRTDDEAFSIYSMDIGGDFDTIIGYRASGGPAISGHVGDLGQGDWLDVIAVEMRAAAYPYGGTPQYVDGYVDNIVVGASVVPIPAAAWLFGSSLGLMGWLRARAFHRNRHIKPGQSSF